MVDIVDKHVNGTDSLFETFLNNFPFSPANDPWDEVQMKDSFNALVVMIDIKSHAHRNLRLFCGVLQL